MTVNLMMLAFALNTVNGKGGKEMKVTSEI